MGSLGEEKLRAKMEEERNGRVGDHIIMRYFMLVTKIYRAFSLLISSVCILSSNYIFFFSFFNHMLLLTDTARQYCSSAFICQKINKIINFKGNKIVFKIIWIHALE